MPDKRFPRDMIALATNPASKLILFTDIPVPPSMSNACQNCGALGFFNVFVATGGGFKEPGFPYNGDEGSHTISHWHDGYWWVGKSYNFPCPDCNGKGESGAIDRGGFVSNNQTRGMVIHPYTEERV